MPDRTTTNIVFRTLAIHFKYKIFIVVYAGFEQGHNDGYGESEKRFKITHKCSFCGKSIVLMPNALLVAAVRAFPKSKGWENAKHWVWDFNSLTRSDK